MRLTKIICTLGPASHTEADIRALAQSGMNIARLNFSHGSHDTHLPTIRLLKDLNERDNLSIGLLLDTKGAEIRTGDRTDPLQITAGETVVFSHAQTDAVLPVVTVNYPEFWQDVKNAEHIIVDNGEMIFDVLEIAQDRVVAKARGGGSIGSRRHVNLPGADVSLPSIAAKDWDDIRLACQEKMDFIALSFIRTGAEVEEVRVFAEKNGHAGIQLVSKIENGIAVKNIDEIIEASDGVMIARGDLGSEIPLHTLPAIQDDIVARCRKAGKPVIVATHMLESMIKSPLPTRAEVTDVAYAAKIGADSTMLSGETAAGKYPLEALRIMGQILEETEKYAPSSTVESATSPETASAVNMSHALASPAIAVFSRSGTAARAVSKLRPAVPVVAFTDDKAVARGLALSFGVYPVIIPFDASEEKTVAEGLTLMKTSFSFKKKSHIPVVTSQQEKGEEVLSVEKHTLP